MIGLRRPWQHVRASPCEWKKPIWLSQRLFCSLRSPPSIPNLKARLTMVTWWRKQVGRRPSRNLKELSCGIRRCRKELVLPVASAGGRWVSLTYVGDAGAREEQSSSKSLRQDHGDRHLLTRGGWASSPLLAQQRPVTQALRRGQCPRPPGSC